MPSSETNIRRNFLFVFLSLMLLLIMGILGYMLIEGWGWVDALYMTVIALSTVGFREIGVLGVAGRIFTMIIIAFGLVFLAMLSASVTSLLLSRELLPSFKRRKLTKTIKNLEGHTILCGAGDTGETIITEFINAGKPLVVIERDSEIPQRLSEMFPNFLVVTGDATKDETLMEANIEKASSLISVLSDDADNLFVVISARSINPKLNIVARAVDSHTMGKMYRAGADHVISPNVIEGLRMAAMVLRPTVVNFLDILVSDDETANRLEEITVPKGSSLHGKTLTEVTIPQKTGAIVMAINIESRGTDSKMVFNPKSSTIISEGDKLVVLGNAEAIEKLIKLMR